ncbi:ABC transporter permease [Putridiphycobacter roseus]|uniref:ABC transporter permease n=1 Tax=Putridiphycobacter roseus TaxID=2219161 RepID=A0A2W1N1L5_9FLAO|nr:ABC transporter permease [Putridiphycobacter roseus]PZE17450.1 ABC transporter permease [Putridiphycobacter roseus]
MKILDLLASALRSINRNRSRSLLTMLGIIIGVASVIGMLALGSGASDSIKGELGKLGTNLIMIRPGADQQRGVSSDVTNAEVLKETDIKAILNLCPTVNFISPVVQTKSQAVFGSNNCRPYVTGAYRDYFFMNNYAIKLGQLYDDRTGKSLQKVCVIGKTVAEDLFVNEKEAVGNIIRIDKIPFRIIGVLEEKGETMGMDGDNIIIAPFRTVQKRLLGLSYVHVIHAATKDENDVDKAVSEIDDVMRGFLKKVSGGEPQYQIATQKEMLDVMGTVLDMLTLLLAAIAGISLIVGGIGIMNIMLVSVTERTREIGLRLAVGAPSNVILWQFLIESIVISLIGGIIGILLGYALAEIGGNVMDMDAEVTMSSVLMAFGFSFMVGIIFGFFPARKAAKLNPIQALRHE